MGDGIAEIAGITRGLTAVTGSGGKTTLIRTLCEELRSRGTVILTTSTHIYPFAEYPLIHNGSDSVSRYLGSAGVVCVGTPAAEGKLTAPGISFEMLVRLADYVLVEADGSKGLPL
ncbi:MAG: selenium cofactor biosynthesis protein YqeC, partial [Lachnospiraceae bacterium]|nr:selenium cofactor biosynthesis protein YqeC [Lachnospiraceae bacterium]